MISKISRKNISNFFLILGSCLLSLGQLQRVPLNAFAATYVHELVFAVWTAFLLTDTKTRSRCYSLIRTSISWLLPLILILLIGWVGAIFAGQLSSYSILYAARLSFYLTWGATVYCSHTISKYWANLSFISAGLLIAFFGILQRIFITDTRSLAILGWDDHYLRLISTQLDPNFTGIILVITFFLMLKLGFPFWQWLIHGQSKKTLKKIQLYITLILLIVLLISLALTISRASILALLIGLIYYLTSYRKTARRPWFLIPSILSMLLITVVVSLVSLFQPGEGTNLLRTSSISARLASSQYWISTLEPYQLFIGRGLFVSPPEVFSLNGPVLQDHANLPDSLLTLLFSGSGLLGILAIGYFFINKATLFYQLSSEQQAILIAVVTHSMFNNTVLQVFVVSFLIGSFLGEKSELIS